MPSLGSIATAVAMAYPIVEAIIHERNSKKAAELRAKLSTLLASNNVRINDLRSGLEKRGIRYNVLMSALSGVSPAGNAWKVKQQADRDYAAETQRVNTQINRLSQASELLSSQMNKQAENLESKGIFRTITGELIK